jgi:hypothetical protein
MSNSLKKLASHLVNLIRDKRYREFTSQRKIIDFEERERLASRVAATLPRASVTQQEMSEDINLLKKDGYLLLGKMLTDQELSDVKEYFSAKLAFDPYRPSRGKYIAPADVPKDTHVSHFYPGDILDAPHLLRVANDERILQLVENYLGAKPTLATLRLWWSSSTSEGDAEHAENFHRDVDDLKFIKLFMYLTDVDNDSGPHVFIRGSHKGAKCSEIRRYSDNEVNLAYGEDAIKVFTGKAGESFLEDTYGLHKGTPPKNRARLIFQPLYTLRPVVYGPKYPLRPATHEERKLDPYVNRVYLKH